PHDPQNAQVLNSWNINMSVVATSLLAGCTTTPDSPLARDAAPPPGVFITDFATNRQSFPPSDVSANSPVLAVPDAASSRETTPPPSLFITDFATNRQSFTPPNLST